MKIYLQKEKLWYVLQLDVVIEAAMKADATKKEKWSNDDLQIRDMLMMILDDF